MTGVDTGTDSGTSKRDRFIAVRKTDVLDALIGHGGIAAADTDRFRRFARLLGAIYHYEYFDRLEALRNDYYYFNPDLPHDAPVAPTTLAQAHHELVATLVGVLGDADFVEMPPDDIARSHRERHALKVEVALSSEGYREVRFFHRGHRRDTVETADWFGLRKRRVTVDVYDHLVLIVMIKPADELSPALARHLASKRLRPGTILIKVFRDVVRGDLKMLFPDVRVVLSLFDKIMLGVPALFGGVPIIFKMLTTFSVLFLVASAYLGAAGAVHDDDIKKALAALSGVVALGGFLTRQWVKYQSQSLKYHKEISDNVYFRNISNNAGALETIVGTAEEQECKEAFLTYAFMAAAAAPVTQSELARRIETWLKERFGVDVTFAIDDALAKLDRLALLRRDCDRLAVPPLDAALQTLDQVWGRLLPPNAAG